MVRRYFVVIVLILLCFTQMMHVSKCCADSYIIKLNEMQFILKHHYSVVIALPPW